MLCRDSTRTNFSNIDTGGRVAFYYYYYCDPVCYNPFDCFDEIVRCVIIIVIIITIYYGIIDIVVITIIVIIITIYYGIIDIVVITIIVIIIAIYYGIIDIVVITIIVIIITIYYGIIDIVVITIIVIIITIYYGIIDIVVITIIVIIITIYYGIIDIVVITIIVIIITIYYGIIDIVVITIIVIITIYYGIIDIVVITIIVIIILNAVKQAIRKISNEEFPSDLVLHVEMEDKATQFLTWRIADASIQTESWETDIILNKLQASLMENQSTFQRLAHENNVLKQSLIEEKTESGWLRLAAQQAEAKTYVETETQSVPQCLSAVTQTEIYRLDAKREAEFSRKFYKAELSESTSIKWIHKPRSRSAGTVK